MNENTLEKLKILADAAKYDVSCSSSGSSRPNNGKGLGNTVQWGICHSFTEDGRCISLLKILLTNVCIYDCVYCVNRRSNDVKRAAFTTKEVVDLTLEFYKRNYIEGLFLSSGVIKNEDYTMERLTDAAKELRKTGYQGYIHLKAIPGASKELIYTAGLYADRLSVNIEIPTEQNLKLLAPEKNYQNVIQPMSLIKNTIDLNIEERKKFKSAPAFAPAGQSTQLIVGASPESDMQVLNLASALYTKKSLKRVYYSGYVPVPLYDNRLPAILQPPLVRENRLYQADWLLRFYNYRADEIVNSAFPNLDLDIDPKLSYALRNPSLFPVDINRADYEMILRIPGVGVKSARLIVTARKYGRLNFLHLKKMGVVMKKAQYFIDCKELPAVTQNLKPETIKKNLLSATVRKRLLADNSQLNLFG